MQRGDFRTVKTIEPIDSGRFAGRYKLIFMEPLPENLNEGDVFENKTWNPAVIIKNCKILKKNRARGILITTPEKVVIENNFFRSGGAALLIEGDVSYWFESGAHNDLIIRNNIFEDCNTSYEQYAIITITPSHKPSDEKTEPYHKNIKIENNVFKTFDYALVKARSVRNLDFVNNEIIRTYKYKPFASQKSPFYLDGCRDVNITGNKISDDFLPRTIEIDHMKKSDIRVEGFKVIKK